MINDSELIGRDTSEGGSVLRRDITLNMGPQHPSTHGVLRVVLDLQGETVVGCRPDIGYLHRGTEKLAEERTYHQIIPLTDRLDYVSAMTNNLAYVMAVEKLIGIEEEIPERAQYLRVIMSELSRLASHLVWLGTHAMDIGAISVFVYCMRERELILDMFEMACGQRITTSYMIVGGIREDVPPKFWTKLQAFLDFYPSKQVEYEDILTKNPIWVQRTRGVGVISAEDAISYGLSGPCLRGSGVGWDIRKAEPYAAYDKVDFEIPIGKNGDTYDRYFVRLEEMRQSVRILKQALAQIPQGPVWANTPKIVMPPKGAVMTTADAMQRHFMWVVRGFHVEPGEVYSSIECPKGELGFYIVSDGSPRPYRMHIRAPSFVNLQALPAMTQGAMVADVVAVLGSIDIVLGEVDR
jgi:NADH-quinone oxidoreductase subunit D